MFIERKINATSNIVELWQCEWENHEGEPARKIFKNKVGIEKSVTAEENESLTQSQAICWSHGRTIGNIAVFSKSIVGSFPAKSGHDAILSCDIVGAGKFRHGAPRWWCRTHHTYWGTKADLHSFQGEMNCGNHDQPMSYQVSPFEINMNDFAEVGIWCSMPAAISTFQIKNRRPKIHVHIRPDKNGKKVTDRDFNAISIRYNKEQDLFNAEISFVNITPPSAFEFVNALEDSVIVDCINCKKCGYPHLDLGDFGITPHKKHFCGNCGFDSTWSKKPIISTPLQPLHDAFPASLNFIDPDRTLNLDDYQGCDYIVWASTPAILWTADRPQEKGIHVHVMKGNERVVDDTFSEVILNGKKLERAALIKQMRDRIIT